MSIEILTDLKTDYVHVRCTGPFNTNAVLEMWQSAFRIALKEGCKAVLVDVRGIHGEPPNISERFDHAVCIAQLQRRFGNQILIAVLGNEPMIDPNRLGESIARSHGAFLGVFTDIGETVNWLKTEVANARELEISLQWRSVLKNDYIRSLKKADI